MMRKPKRSKRLTGLFNFIRAGASRFVRGLEPARIPPLSPEEILQRQGWHEQELQTINGRFACLRVAVRKCRRAAWESLFSRRHR